MLSLLVMATTAVSPLPASATLPCEGIKIIEASTTDRPRPFASLREQGMQQGWGRNAAGQRVRQMVPVTNVKALAGLSSCRFVYSVSQIDLACYVGATLPETDKDAIAAKLNATAEALGACLTDRALVRSESEEGSSPAVTFGAGPRHAFWQVSMVPTQDDLTRVQPEILVLGPVPVSTPRQPAPKAKAKRKRG